MGTLTAENISVNFDGEKIIENVCVELREGETVSLLGVSGGGKTTLFNVLSGLTLPDEGKVYLDSKDITGKPGRVSYMLQKDLLLPHYTVIDNACLGLVINGMKKNQARKEDEKYIEIFGLEGQEKKYPHQLSGGMRQRVAFLRTYLDSEGVILLDEPFSALDSITKQSIHRWYLLVMEKLKLSTIFVTHDIDEAILLSDRIYILSGKPGKITDEIEINLEKDKSLRNPMSSEFISYKQLLSKKIGTI